MPTFSVWPLGWHEDRAVKIAADGPGEAATLFADSTWTRDVGDVARSLLVRDTKNRTVIAHVECVVRRSYVCNLTYEIKAR